MPLRFVSVLFVVDQQNRYALDLSMKGALER